MQRTPQHIVLSGLLLLLLATLFGACSQPISSSTLADEAFAPTPITAPLTLGADLQHNPQATADLTWNAKNQTLTIRVAATGLAPKSIHPEHIHAGRCARSTMGQLLYTLTPLVANAQGVATSTTRIAQVAKGIPTTGWYMNIHNGTTLRTEFEARSIACADITTRQQAAPTTQTLHLTLMPTTAPDEAVHGTASIMLNTTAVLVTLVLHGLTPFTTHMAHIHAGSCASQGPVVATLHLVTADAQGNATTKTLISPKDLTNLPVSQLYINVHEAGTMLGMSLQQGFNPIACGNIELRKV